MKDFKTILPIFLFSAALITLLSCTSWIYPLQPVDDANWYMSIGKGMLRGKLLYTDLHDQKGPLLFFLHAWAAMLSERTFLGIYLIQVICACAFLLFSYRTMRLFSAHGISLLCTFLVGVLTYSSDFMWYGDTVEELSLPVLLFVLYKTLRYAKQDELPGGFESALIGMGLACVFWMKFTVLAMCSGAFVALFLLAWRRRQVLLLLQTLMWTVAGACIPTAAVLSYFVVHGNEPDLYHSYFYFNIFLYTDAGKMDASASWWPLKWGVWLAAVAFVLTRRASCDAKLAVAFCLGAALLPFCIFKVYLYYFLPVFVFAPLGIIYVRRLEHRRCLLACGACLLTVGALATNFNLMTLLTGRFPKAVLALADVVNVDKDAEKEVLTVKSYDTGIYTLTDCLPPIKFFSTPNAYVSELVEEQTACLASRRCKYVILKDNGFEGYYDSFHPDLDSDYELIREERDVYRPEFIMHPLEFLWTLGYMQGFIERFHEPERRTVAYRLYRLKGAESISVDAGRLRGEWEMRCGGGTRYVLGFTDHGIMRVRKYAKGEVEDDKFYGFACGDGRLRLSYMYMGSAYKAVEVGGVSASKLILTDWPQGGRCLFERTSAE